MGDSVFTPPGYEMQSGPGLPASDLGMDTDRYLDTSGLGFYEKVNGTWIKRVDFGGLRLQLLTATTVGETLGIAVSLGVRRYTVTATGAATGDKLFVALTGPPTNGTLQDAYVSATNTANVGLLVPAVGLGAVVAVPCAIYKVI